MKGAARRQLKVQRLGVSRLNTRAYVRLGDNNKRMKRACMYWIYILYELKGTAWEILIGTLCPKKIFVCVFCAWFGVPHSSYTSFVTITDVIDHLCVCVWDHLGWGEGVNCDACGILAVNRWIFTQATLAVFYERFCEHALQPALVGCIGIMYERAVVVQRLEHLSMQ